MSKLYIIPTPIGNLKDITLRALETLQEVDVILAEDTRQTSKLLKHYNIDKKLIAHHQHNEHHKIERVIEEIKSGVVIGLVSDAGTPAISDPGFLLARECIKNGIEIETLPGATAFVPALVNSGFPCDKFVFEGFLPHKKGRQTRLNVLKEETRTVIFYESTHRLIKTLTQLAEFFGEDRQVSVSRELTKMHEENIRGTVKEVLEYYNNNIIKGEIVIVVHGIVK
ncbi:16S rRNA (cytidine(1402)-2'-O)-methyltransferase [Vicingus serpentipes]|uniref:Ribosomal RNA small subunit methyltransferase I n=1 Tax=Vicingus serpentipes TaxID=1926625 RepID=A0A5C6RPI4_9FLAO|nr:16S rRNA (cytidine(1402)-2'-O)-methyltransferase [Vicingus serpentipes]TXB64236.1 16S rRNA (cytidine(1402)-2'-O)-methyltransferase [Vicingus serpentipes]